MNPKMLKRVGIAVFGALVLVRNFKAFCIALAILGVGWLLKKNQISVRDLVKKSFERDSEGSQKVPDSTEEFVRTGPLETMKDHTDRALLKAVGSPAVWTLEAEKALDEGRTFRILTKKGTEVLVICRRPCLFERLVFPRGEHPDVAYADPDGYKYAYYGPYERPVPAKAKSKPAVPKAAASSVSTPKKASVPDRKKQSAPEPSFEPVMEYLDEEIFEPEVLETEIATADICDAVGDPEQEAQNWISDNLQYLEDISSQMQLNGMFIPGAGHEGADFMSLRLPKNRRLWQPVCQMMADQMIIVSYELTDTGAIVR